MLGRHAQDRAQLGGQDLGALRAPGGCPRTPRNGLSSGGIGRAGSGLSAPASSVRTISGRPPSASAIARRVVDLLVLAGELVAVQEQELGAQQPDALGPELDRLRARRRPAEVGEHLHALAVARDGGLVRALARGGACALGAPRARSSRARSALGGAGRPSARPPRRRAAARALGDRRARPSPSPTTAGQPERAGEDRGVSGGRAARGGDAPHRAGSRPAASAGRELVGDRRCPARRAPARRSRRAPPPRAARRPARRPRARAAGARRAPR